MKKLERILKKTIEIAACADCANGTCLNPEHKKRPVKIILPPRPEDLVNEGVKK